MKRTHSMLPFVVVIVALTAAPVAAEPASSGKTKTAATISTNSGSKSDHASGSSQASAKIERTWDRTKAMTHREWNAAKRKWASEKVKWQDCNKQADVEKLAAPKSWSFVANCMTGS